jgi:hypothetical protein
LGQAAFVVVGSGDRLVFKDDIGKAAQAQRVGQPTECVLLDLFFGRRIDLAVVFATADKANRTPDDDALG